MSQSVTASKCGVNFYNTELAVPNYFSRSSNSHTFLNLFLSIVLMYLQKLLVIWFSITMIIQDWLHHKSDTVFKISNVIQKIARHCQAFA